MSHLTTTTAPEGIQPHRRKPLLLWVGGIVGALVLLALIALAALMMYMNYVPADLDTSTTLTTDGGLYRATYVTKLDPIRINQIHSWILHIETADGNQLRRL